MITIMTTGYWSNDLGYFSSFYNIYILLNFFSSLDTLSFGILAVVVFFLNKKIKNWNQNKRCQCGRVMWADPIF